ncbi:MAG: hypothetical protein SF029_15130, partial [bacterium]|nr:hypothetical protein [bacterium]
WLNLLIAPDGVAQFRGYLEDHLAPALLHFVGHPDSSRLYYGGETGLVLPPLVPLLLIGAGVMLRRARGRVLLLIPLLTAFGNSLINVSDASARFVVAFPALAILLAVGIVAVVQWVMRRLNHRAHREHGAGLASRSWIVQAAAAFILLGLSLQILYYFGPHLTLYNQQIRPFRDHQDVGWRLADLPPDVQGFLFTDELTFQPHIEGMARFWGRPLNLTITDPYYLLQRGVHYLPRGVDIALFVQPDNRELLNYLDRVFDLPAPQVSPYNVPRDKQYVLFLLDF